MNTNIFDFHHMDNSTEDDKRISFGCPVCGGICETIGLNEYIPHHDFFIGLDFFCSECFSQYRTIKNSKIKLMSKALMF